MTDTILKKININGIESIIYESGLLIQSGMIKDKAVITLPVHFSDTNFIANAVKIGTYSPKQYYKEKNAYVKDINYRKTIHDFVGIYPQQILYKTIEMTNGSTYIYICPINKTAKTSGILGQSISTLKGPTKTVNVENISIDSSIGVNTGTVSEIKLNIGVNQYITLQIDVPGAKINNLPTGFVFNDNAIVGTVKNPGEYKFNITSESTSIPVTLIASNVIRIS